jgi:hypothetical protein
LLLCMQQVVSAQQTESNYPRVLDTEAVTFLQKFQEVVTYLADKRNPDAQKRLLADSFAQHFQADALIEVVNGSKTERLKPSVYFRRLIDLKYETVAITFAINKRNHLVSTAQNRWNAQYEIGQTFKGTRKGKKGEITVADYTIKTVDMHFVYTPQTKTWTKQFGHVKTIYNQRL